MAITEIKEVRFIDRILAENALLREGTLNDLPFPRPVIGRTYRIPDKHYKAYTPAFVNGKYRCGCYLVMEDIETGELALLNLIVLTKKVTTIEDGCTKTISSISFINKILMENIRNWCNNLSYGNAIDILKWNIQDAHIIYTVSSYSTTHYENGKEVRKMEQIINLDYI